MFRERLRKNNHLGGCDPYEGLSLPREIEKFQTEGGEIETGSPLLYTKRSDGVLPQTNIRTDRFEMAQSRMEIAQEAENAQRLKKKADRDAKTETSANPTETKTTEQPKTGSEPSAGE